MINKLASEIKDFWSKNQSGPLHFSSEIKVVFERGSLNVITLVLTRGAYSAQQELTLGNTEQVTNQLMDDEFLTLLKRRLETLEDSMDDMLE